MSMRHGYSTLRPTGKGRQGRHQSTDETDDQVEGTSTSTSNTSEGGPKALTNEPEGEPGTVDPRLTTPDSDTPRAATHNSPAPTRVLEHQATEEDLSLQQYLLRGNSNAPTGTTKYHIRRGASEPEIRDSDEIREDLKRREEAICRAAVRIQREQTVRVYQEELRALHARIAALRREREAEVERMRRKRERTWAFERGEVLMGVEDGEEGLVGSDSDPEEAHNEDRKKKHYAPAETSSNDDDQRWQCPSRPAPCWSHSRSKFPPPSLGKTQHGRPQPLRRQPLQLMVIPDIDSEMGG